MVRAAENQDASRHTAPGAASESLDGDPIDRKHLARYTLGNAALEREILELFATHLPLYLDRLQAAETSRDWKDAAHSIKGSAAGVGAKRLACFAERAERLDVISDQALGEGHRQRAAAAIAAAIDEVCGHIARLFAAR